MSPTFYVYLSLKLTYCSKRRRNTEASARFRAKKKEREQKLEHRASMLTVFSWCECVLILFAEELEAQVAQLSADKASLENENRLLKAIVLGGSGGQGGASGEALAQLVGKRKREQV